MCGFLVFNKNIWKKETLSGVSLGKQCLSTFLISRHVFLHLWICLCLPLFVCTSEMCLISISTSVNLDLIVCFILHVFLFVLHLSTPLHGDSLSGYPISLVCSSSAEFTTSLFPLLLEVLAVQKLDPMCQIWPLGERASVEGLSAHPLFSVTQDNLDSALFSNLPYCWDIWEISTQPFGT